VVVEHGPLGPSGAGDKTLERARKLPPLPLHLNNNINHRHHRNHRHQPAYPAWQPQLQPLQTRRLNRISASMNYTKYGRKTPQLCMNMFTRKFIRCPLSLYLINVNRKAYAWPTLTCQWFPDVKE
jgi:hypothetical protein